jgi:hypothetical protein
MNDSELDPLQFFVESVRSQIGGSDIVVGPVSRAGDDGSRVIEVVGGAREPSAAQPFVSLAWTFKLPGADAAEKSDAEWGTWRFLADLLRRDFRNVEPCGNQLDFARAVERRWPCPLAI